MSEPVARRRLEGLDGLRGLLALSVVVAHVVGHLAPDSTAPLHLGLLAQAVVVFFTLSGFLIFLPFCRAILTGADLPRLGHYALRRITRIYPAYVLIFLVTNFVLAAVFTANVLEVSEPRSDVGTGRMTGLGEVLLHLTLVQNLVPDEIQRGLNVSWSLSTELGFYLLVPLIAVATLALVRRSQRSPALLVLAPILVMTVVALVSKALLTREVATSGKTLDEVTFGPHGWAILAESTVALADVFAAGMAAAVVFVLIGQGRLASWTGGRLHRWGASLIVVSGIAALIGLSAHSAFANTFLAITAGTLLVLVTEPTARGQVSPIGRLLDVRPIKFLGDTSLSIYLWHFPVLVLVTRWGWYGADSLPGAAWSVLLVTAITLVLSAVTYRFVERPAMNCVESAHGLAGKATGRGTDGV
jgi:peptidoglycan/LPS O-acetylase OafA/YrhL